MTLFFIFTLVYFLEIHICSAVFDNRVHLNWWDQDTDNARIFFDDGPAKISEFPYVVSVIYRNPNRASDSFKCGGINVGLNYQGQRAVIVTTGSCVYQFEKQGIDVSNVIVRTNSEYWDCPCGITKEYHAYQWIKHPNFQEHVIPFSGAISLNDIALIALDGPWKGLYNVMAVARPLLLTPPGQAGPMHVTILGWGYTDQQNSTTIDLRVATEMFVISAQICASQYYKEFFPDNSFCIGSVRSPGINKSPCVGDDGGPVIYTATSYTAGPTYLIGLISTGARCGDMRKPAIILNTTNYIDFIQDLSWISEPTDAPPTDSTPITDGSSQIITEDPPVTPPDNPENPNPRFLCRKDSSGKIRCCREMGKCVVWQPGSDSWSWRSRDRNRDFYAGEFQGGWGGFDTAPWGADNF